MAASVLSGILKVDKDTKKAFLSIDATLQKMYKLEADKNKREIKQRKEEQQAKKTAEKEKNILEDILGELKKSNKGDKDKDKKKSLMETLFDFIKGPALGLAAKLGSAVIAIAPFIKAIGIAAAALKGLSDFGNWWKGSKDKPGLASNIDFGKKGADLGQRIRDEKENKNYQRGKQGYRQRSEWEGGNAMQYGLTSAYDRDKMRGQFEELLIDLKNDEAKALEDARPKVSKKTNRGVVEEKGTIDPAVKAKIEKDYERRRAALEQRYIDMFGPGGSADKKQRGGPITIPGTGSGDKVPMMLPPGSFVMNRNASAMLQNGGLVPTLLEPGEKVFGPNEVSPLHHMLNSMIPRFQEGGTVATNSEGARDKATNKGPTKSVSRGVYIEGGWGPSGPNAFGAHYHIHKSDRSNFGRTGLDQWVTVDGKRLSSGLTVPGGQWGAPRSYGGHQGIDFAFGGGKELSLKNGAEWIASQKSSYGDKTAFKTPNGVYELLHGTFKGDTLPMKSDGGEMASASTGEIKPQNALDMLMGAVSGLGIVGKAISGMVSSLGKIAGSELMSALFGMGPAVATQSPTPSTGVTNMSGGTADTSLTPNRKAMLDAIAMAEGTSKYPENGYKTMFTGKQFSAPPWEHPRQIQRGGGHASDAAGRYQFLSTTWGGLGISDFSPTNQDKGAIKLLQRRNALQFVDQGKWDKAFTAANKEWASFPGAGYGQPEKNMQKLVAYTQVAAQKYSGTEAKMQTGGLVNMSGSQSPNTARFKEAQREFAQMIADKSGSPIIVMGGGGGQSGPTVVSTPNMQSPVPNLPDGPSSIQAAEYFYRLNLGSVL